MKIVLLDDMPNLGEAGTVVTVKDGYGRNFLLPRRLGEMATRDALNRVGLIKRAAEVKRLRRRAEASDKFAALVGKSITLTFKAGTQSRLFGAVTSQLISDEVRKQLGVELERRHIVLDEPIKHLGEYTVSLRAAADVTGEIKVIVNPEGPRGLIGGAGGRRAAMSQLQSDALNQGEPKPSRQQSGGSWPSEHVSAPPEPLPDADAAAVPESSEVKYEDLEKSIEG
jgi:large subunit ribosomal protein L9